MEKIARIILLLTLLLLTLGPALISCNNRQETPEEIRKQAADAAAQLKKESAAAAKDIKKDTKEFGKDAEAAAQGVKDGWNRDNPDRRRPAEKKRPAQE